MADNNHIFCGHSKLIYNHDEGCVIGLLEKGEVPLDECLSLFEEGVKLSKDSIEMLNKAEQKIRLLTENEDGTVAETDFVSADE